MEKRLVVARDYRWGWWWIGVAVKSSTKKPGGNGTVLYLGWGSGYTNLHMW